MKGPVSFSMPLEILLILLNVPALILGHSLSECGEDFEKVELCAKHKNYSFVDYPTPLPVSINTTFVINDILSVNENFQTIRILVTLNVNWTDNRVKLRTNNGTFLPSGYPWYKLEKDEFEAVWTPSKHFFQNESLSSI